MTCFGGWPRSARGSWSHIEETGSAPLLARLISEPQEENPSTVMQALKLGFARRVLAQTKRKGNPQQDRLFDDAPQHIWQKRFYDFNVWTERKRTEKLRYMHGNPVKRGLVASAELLEVEQFSSVRSRGSQ